MLIEVRERAVRLSMRMADPGMPRKILSKPPRKLAIAGFAVAIWLAVVASEIAFLLVLSAATSHAAESRIRVITSEYSTWKA